MDKTSLIDVAAEGGKALGQKRLEMLSLFAAPDIFIPSRAPKNHVLRYNVDGQNVDFQYCQH
jgi:hypothetical protein